MKDRLWLLLTAALLLASLLVPSVASALTYDQAVDKLVKNGYPQRLTDHICSLGTSPMGFRFGGSYSDNQAARYIARQMRKIGLENVHHSSACPPTSTRSTGPSCRSARRSSPRRRSAASRSPP